MINTLHGTVNSSPIIFQRNDDNTWSCEVPYIENGEYVVELYAQDDAGNETYFATILFSIDFKKLVFSFEWLKIGDMANRSNDYDLMLNGVIN